MPALLFPKIPPFRSKTIPARAVTTYPCTKSLSLLFMSRLQLQEGRHELSPEPLSLPGRTPPHSVRLSPPRNSGAAVALRQAARGRCVPALGRGGLSRFLAAATRRKRRRWQRRSGSAGGLRVCRVSPRRPAARCVSPVGTGGSMSVAGLKKQFYKASQVRHRDPRLPLAVAVRPLSVLPEVRSYPPYRPRRSPADGGSAVSIR